MKSYPDPQEHYHDYTDRAARRYVEGVQQQGLAHSDILLKAYSQRVNKEAQADYEEQLESVFLHNLSIIEAQHQQQAKHIRRQGAKNACMFCPFALVLFGFAAWYNFTISGDHTVAWIYVAGMLPFSVMLMVSLCTLARKG